MAAPDLARHRREDVLHEAGVTHLVDWLVELKDDVTVVVCFGAEEPEVGLAPHHFGELPRQAAGELEFLSCDRDLSGQEFETSAVGQLLERKFDISQRDYFVDF